LVSTVVGKVGPTTVASFIGFHATSKTSAKPKTKGFCRSPEDDRQSPFRQLVAALVALVEARQAKLWQVALRQAKLRK